MKDSSDTIGDRTRDLPACIEVPQPTAPPRASSIQYIFQNEILLKSGRAMTEANRGSSGSISGPSLWICGRQCDNGTGFFFSAKKAI